MAVNQNAIDRLHLDEAFTEKMLHRAFNNGMNVVFSSETYWEEPDK